jgi:hypothetical protein
LEDITICICTLGRLLRIAVCICARLGLSVYENLGIWIAWTMLA